MSQNITELSDIINDKSLDEVIDILNNLSNELRSKDIDTSKSNIWVGLVRDHSYAFPVAKPTIELKY